MGENEVEVPAPEPSEAVPAETSEEAEPEAEE